MPPERVRRLRDNRALLFKGAVGARLPDLFSCVALVGGPRLRGLSFSRGDRLLEQLLHRHTVTFGDFSERRVLGILRTELDSSKGVAVHTDLLCRVLDGEPTLRSQEPKPVRKRLLRHTLPIPFCAGYVAPR